MFLWKRWHIKPDNAVFQIYRLLEIHKPASYKLYTETASSHSSCAFSFINLSSSFFFFTKKYFILCMTLLLLSPVTIILLRMKYNS